MIKKIIYIPSIKKGQGSGHFRRALRFAESSSNSVSILLPNEKETIDYTSLIPSGIDIITMDKVSGIGNADLVITDLFRMSPEQFSVFRKIGPVAALDEGGQLRKRIPFLIDTLPSVKNKKSNIKNWGFHFKGMSLLDEGKKQGVLISFGGEDPAQLTKAVYLFLQKSKPQEKVTIIQPPGVFIKSELDTIEVIYPVKNLSEYMQQFTGIITSFGLTALEAVFSGIPCLTINPGFYHCRLSAEAGFLSSKLPGVRKRFIRKFFRERSSFLNSSIQNLTAADMPGLISESDVLGYFSCPVCGKSGTVIERTEKRSYMRCSCTGIIYLFSFGEKQEEYSDSYFALEYQKQYGRTYIEDFNSIKNAGLKRAAYIAKLNTSGNTEILDIGCAYGPFLSAASEEGLMPSGCDVSSAAIDYVKSELLFPVWKVPEQAVFQEKKWAAVSMWYVIEHLKNLDEMLNDVYQHLLPGGVFAFSTPSYSGISGRKKLSRFLTSGPRDHFSVWSPGSAKKVLKKYGFHVKKIVVTGHHPERFNLPLCRTKFGSAVFGFISKMFCLGDTFEIYAVKIKEAVFD